MHQLVNLKSDDLTTLEFTKAMTLMKSHVLLSSHTVTSNPSPKNDWAVLTYGP